MRARALIAAAVLAVGAAVALLVVAVDRHDDRDDTTRLSTVDSYLRALSARDRDSLTALAEPYGGVHPAGQGARIDDQLRRYGGSPIVVASLTFVNALWTTTSAACQAVVRADIGGRPAAFVVGLQLKPEGGWQVTFIDEQLPPPDTPACS